MSVSYISEGEPIKCASQGCTENAKYKVHQGGRFCANCVPRCEACGTPDDSNVCEGCMNEHFDAAYAAGVAVDDDFVLAEWIKAKTAST